MRHSRSKAIRYVLIGLLCIPLSGCQVLWVIGLQIDRISRRSEPLPNTAMRLDDCIVNQPCDRTFTLQMGRWPVDPWPSVYKGELPAELDLSTQPVPNQPESYTVSLKGTPMTSGNYSFQIGFDCCMTMSGPAQEVHTETITLSVKE